MKLQKLLPVAMILVFTLTQYGLQFSAAQETPQFFQQTNRSPNNCPITHLYSNKMNIPVTIKIFHDPTSNFVGSTKSLTNSTNSLTTMDGVSSKYAFIFNTNSTDQWLYTTTGGWNDGQEHIIWAEYWSNNQDVGLDQFVTVNGTFCHDFFVDTSLPPVQPDIGKTVQEAQAGLFAQIIKIMSDDHFTIGNLSIAVIGTIVMQAIVLVVVLIFQKGQDDAKSKDMERIEFTAKSQRETISLIKVSLDHMEITDKHREERLGRFFQVQKEYLISLKDVTMNMFHTMLLESKLFTKEQIDAIEQKVVIKVEDDKQEVDEPVEEIKTENLPPPKQTRFEKFKSSIQNIGNKSKQQKKIRTEEEWIQFFTEKKLTYKQILKNYEKKLNYYKNHPDDIDALNQVNAMNKMLRGEKK